MLIYKTYACRDLVRSMKVHLYIIQYSRDNSLIVPCQWILQTAFIQHLHCPSPLQWLLSSSTKINAVPWNFSIDKQISLASGETTKKKLSFRESTLNQLISRWRILTHRVDRELKRSEGNVYSNKVREDTHTYFFCGRTTNVRISPPPPELYWLKIKIFLSFKIE